MEFGTQVRQDTLGDVQPQIDPPALRVTPRDTVVQKQAKSTGVEEGFESLGKGLGATFANIMEERNAKIAEQKKQETIARQGLNVSVNNEDEKLRRTGWAETLFGQNPQYALAQQMAVEQRIKQDAMQLLANIDDYKETHPTQFREVVLREKLDRILAGYDNDPEMRGKLSETWFKRVGTLVDNHYKSWFANAQQQTFERAKADVLVSADEWSQQMDLLSSTNDQDKIGKVVQDAVKFMDTRGEELGMSPAAWRRAKLEAAQVSLTEGNKNLYDLMDRTGELEQLAPQERRAINTALNNYDVRFRQSVDALWAETETDLQLIDNIDEGFERIGTFLNELKAAESRASGSEHSKLTLQRGERSAARFQKRLRKELERQMKGVADNEVKRDKEDELLDSFDKPLLDRLSAQGVHTTRDVEKAYDKYLLERVLEPLGIDISDEYTVGAQVFRNPEVAEILSKKLVKSEVKSQLVSNMLSQFAHGWRNMYDESGRPTEDGVMLMRSVERFRANGVIKKYLDTEEAKDLEFVATRMQSGMPPAAIEKDFAAWKNSRTDAVSGVTPSKGQNKRDAELQEMNRIARMVYGQDIDVGTQTLLRDQYYAGLRIYNNDHRKAMEYVRTHLENDMPIVNGQGVIGGASFSKFPVTREVDGKTISDNLSLETVLNNNFANLAPWFAVAKGLAPEEYQSTYSGKSLQDQPVRFFTEFGDDDNLYVDFVDGIQAVPIPRDVLQELAQKAFVQQQIKDDIEARRKLQDVYEMWNYVGGSAFGY